ncbi:EAL domain-containing protein, partial [Akkermansia muciniphila]|uniref:EAL domain-containing protein n=1 Tax=Akkermansia muciniphila TaxID=239935 RepID=UPI00122F1272
FMVYLQPKVRLDDQSTVGAEALIRYRASDDSILLPGHFLPLLEDSDLISQVDFYVFEIACSKVKQWIGEGRSTVPVSVNFSRNTLAQPGFIERLITIADKYQVPRQWLEIEITESVETMADIDVKALIAAVHDAGFTVSVDDFGTHYANLSLLSAVDFDVLKIDKSLVDDIVHNEKTRSLLGALAQVCKQMGTDMIAEGIESQEQADVLQGLGIAKAQGFLFSKPVPLSVYETQFLK